MPGTNCSQLGAFATVGCREPVRGMRG